jgi:hypothetical protein
MAAPNPSELGDYAPGIVGAIAAAAITLLKDGWRPALLILVVGSASAWAFKDLAIMVGQKMSFPSDSSNFVFGAMAAHALKKVLEQLANVELAGPFNEAWREFLLRWTGTAPKVEKP